MNVKLFVKDDCPRCPAAKQALAGLDELLVYDVSEMDGLAEASFYGVLSTPSALVVDADGNEIESWRGVVPDRARIRDLLAQ
ncbi:MAG: thioredoxin family protein [Actinomycetota bacterium]|nr:thioredoxin family protein [Actinomycetota bacterium]